MGIGEQFAIGAALVGHGLKLDDLEQFAVFSGSFLEEEGTGSLVGDGEPDIDHEQHW